MEGLKKGKKRGRHKTKETGGRQRERGRAQNQKRGRTTYPMAPPKMRAAPTAPLTTEAVNAEARGGTDMMCRAVGQRKE